MKFERINVTVSTEEKQVQLDYQRQNNYGDQGEALGALLMKFKEMSEE